MFRSQNTEAVGPQQAEYFPWLSNDDPSEITGPAADVKSIGSFRPTERLTEDCAVLIGGDRRTRRRYPLHLDVTFRIFHRGCICQTGAGRTVNISSAGLAFATDNPPEPGSTIELSVAWPVRLNDTCALQLMITGKIVRSGSGRAAVRVQKYEFRTKAQSNVRTMAARAAFDA